MRIVSGVAGMMCVAGVAGAEAPRVVTDILPVQGLVAQVMKGVGSPDVVIGAGSEPHGHQMRPSQARALSDAELVFWVGPGLSASFEKAQASLASDAINVSLMDVAGTLHLEQREDHEHHDHGEKHADEDHHDEEHHDEAKHDDHDEDHHDDHADEEHGDAHHEASEITDPHLWLHPDNATLWLTAIAEALATQDPDNAGTYRANATEGQAQINAAAQDLGTTLDQFKGRTFVATHDAYQYLEVAYDLTVTTSIVDAQGAKPGARRMQDAHDTLEGVGGVCVLTEPTYNPRLVSAVVGDAPYKIAPMDPLGADLAMGPAFYPELLRSFATGLTACE